MSGSKREKVAGGWRRLQKIFNICQGWRRSHHVFLGYWPCNSISPLWKPPITHMLRLWNQKNNWAGHV